MGKRKQYDFYIGLKGPAWEFEEPLIKEVNAVAGGCTVQRSIGYWVEGAVNEKDRYSGPTEDEFCFHLSFSVIPSKAESAYGTVRAAIRQLARKYGIDTDWVHVTETDVYARHFSVKQSNKLGPSGGYGWMRG